jgi:hypothetical protein
LLSHPSAFHHGMMQQKGSSHMWHLDFGLSASCKPTYLCSL